MCDCIENVNKELEARDRKLRVHTVGGLERIIVATRTIEFERFENVSMLPIVPVTYCPFCGQRYEVELEDMIEKEVERRR